MVQTPASSAEDRQPDSTESDGHALSRRRFFGLTGALLALGGGWPATDAFALTDADPGASSGGAAPRRGGVLDAVVTPEPPTLAIFLNTSTPGRAVASKIFDGLLDYGADLKPRPQLAESVTPSADGLSWTIRLRQGVQWHDGKPFTAADVKYSGEVIWKQYAPVARRLFQYLTRVDTPDSHTAILRLSKPSPVILNALDAIAAPILPRHLYEGTDILNNPYNNRPVGTGPFVFKSWQRGSDIQLTRFAHYWRENGPYLDGITWKIVPDAGARAVGLETGSVKYGERNPVTFSDADRLAQSPSLVVSRAGYNGFAANFWLIPNLRHPILGNLKVRQAILHAINRAALVNTVWRGYAKPATGPVSSLLKTFYTADTPQYAFDRKAAEALLDEAGYPRKADGWRFRINHDFIPYGDDYQRTGEFVRQALRAVGIDVTLRAFDLAAWTKNVFTDYAFDLVSSWGVNWQDPQIGVEQYFWSKAAVRGVAWQNAAGYASAETDRVIEAAQVETDLAKRVALYAQLQRLVQRDLPQLYLFEFRWFGVWDKHLRNVADTYDHSQSNFAEVGFDNV
ncbi:ABC transporter substrate-binding protein [Burkholderia sp. 22PA0099]|uniref:ABC transporter substrate-binding protein n=1 Tax=Burkholderia sp. 22PA0099 TaxID=3237372 RepID=UPI0039C370A3